MGSKISKEKRPTFTRFRTAVPRIPQDIVHEILDHLTADLDFDGSLKTCTVASLRSCALVSKSWVQPCQQHLFRTIVFTSRNMETWLKVFPVPKESPSHYVRNLHIWTGGTSCTPEKFPEYASWFPNTEKIRLKGYGKTPPLPLSSPLRLSQLDISAGSTGGITLVQVRDVMARLPNLDNVLLSGCFVATDSRELLGIGTVLRGRFGGTLRLCGEYADEDVINMLLEIPSGLRFTEVQIHCMNERPPSAVRLIEACGETLVKLSHTVDMDGSPSTGACQPSFDFSKFPNLQEVSFRLSWIGGSPHWIPMALSTLRPATSPRLFAIRLDFARVSSINQPLETLVERLGNDLRWIADEFVRIEREFEGAVNLTVVRGPEFEVLLDMLNILQSYSR